QKNLLTRTSSAQDRRAAELKLTAEGETVCDAIGAAIETQSNFVRCFRRLSADDQSALARIMGELHNELDRDFLAAGRGKL
ncbi:MAG TPA: hypothetical protein VFM32_06145, partial [Spongiibacteraceae bacterium]|nr:hypothetical protein [Spongiibacteraceae bacterium]